MKFTFQYPVCLKLMWSLLVFMPADTVTDTQSSAALPRNLTKDKELTRVAGMSK